MGIKVITSEDTEEIERIVNEINRQRALIELEEAAKEADKYEREVINEYEEDDSN